MSYRQLDRAESFGEFLCGVDACRVGVADTQVEVDLLWVGGVGPSWRGELDVLECQGRRPSISAGDDDSLRRVELTLGHVQQDRVEVGEGTRAEAVDDHTVDPNVSSFSGSVLVRGIQAERVACWVGVDAK